MKFFMFDKLWQSDVHARSRYEWNNNQKEKHAISELVKITVEFGTMYLSWYKWEKLVKCTIKWN